jgi:cardiolipin synthase A/B
VRIEGPAVLQMQRLFLENWLYTTGEFLEGIAQFPVPDQVGQVKAQAVGSSRTSQLSMAKLHYYMPIQAAHHCIWIQNAYWLPDKDFQTALAAAARRGVDVRIIVPGKQTDIKALRYAGRRTYRKLLDAGVRIYEFQPTMLHAKAMMVDNLWCSIGSINFTSRSMKSNAEANVALYDMGFTKQLRANMEADMARSKPITLQEWKERGLGPKIQETYYGLYTGLF